MKNRHLFKAALMLLCLVLLVSFGATSALAGTENSLPTLKAGVENDITVNLWMNQPYTIDFSTIFEDADGDTMSYGYAWNATATYFMPITGSEYEFIGYYQQAQSLYFAASDSTGYSTQKYHVTFNVSYPTAPYPNPTVSENAGQFLMVHVGDESPVITATEPEHEGFTTTYQWYESTVSNSYSAGTAIEGATNSSFTPSTSTPGLHYYYVEIKNTALVDGEYNYRKSYVGGITGVLVSDKSDVVFVSRGIASIKLFTDGSEVTLPELSISGANKYYELDLDRSKTYTCEFYDSSENLIGEKTFTPTEGNNSYRFVLTKLQTSPTLSTENFSVSIKDSEGNPVEAVAAGNFWQMVTMEGEKYTYETTIKSGLGYKVKSTSAGEKALNLTNSLVKAGNDCIFTTYLDTVYEISFTVPSKAEFVVAEKPSNSKGALHYVPFIEQEPAKIVTLPSEGTTTYYYEFISGSVYNLRLTMEGKITYADKFTATASKAYTISENDLKDSGTEANDDIQARIYTTAPKSSHIVMENAGDTYTLAAFRAAQTIDTMTTNYFFEPDYHVSFISGEDVVSVDENLKITALKEGEAIMLVTYDKLDTYTMNQSSDNLAKSRTIYKALPSNNIGVVAITVGKGTVETGIDLDADLESVYYIQTLNGTKVEGACGTYSFTPEEGSSVSILHIKPTETGVDYSEGFVTSDITKNEDGSFTAKLTDGRNLLKIEKDGKVSYQLISSSGMNVSFYNTADNSRIIRPGDEVKVSVSGVVQPVIKMSGIYNPQNFYPTYDTPDGEEANTSKSSSFSFTVPADYTKDCYELINGTIYEWWFGSELGAHREIDTEEGISPNLNAGSPSVNVCVLENIKIPITQPDSRHSVEFKLPEGASLTLKDSGGHRMLADSETGLYKLPEGDYTYTASGEGYKTATFSMHFDNTEDMVISVPMELVSATETWDGTTQEPELVEGVYQITNAKELAWFRDEVNDGQNSINGILLNDIALSSEYNWTPIGNADMQYNGTFDGDGHTITDMTINAFKYQGLFGYVGRSGVVKNVEITGTMTNETPDWTAGAAYHGGIAGYNFGTVSGCTSRVEITGNVYGMLGAGSGEASTGGIVGRNAGTIENCVNYGTVDFLGQGIGGIAGYAQQGSKIISCVNHGTIKNAQTNTGGIVGEAMGNWMQRVVIQNSYNDGKIISSANNTGGIVGKATNVNMNSCYNSGKVDATYNTGGIAGYTSLGSIANCYNSGKVTGSEGYTAGIVGYNVMAMFSISNTYNVGNADYQPILGNKTSGTITNVYYLTSTLAEGTTNNAAAAEAKTSDELKALASTLGEEFTDDNLLVNDGYPILTWQPHGEVEAPVITTDLPTEITVGQGEQIPIEVKAEGTNLTYKWFAMNSDGVFEEVPYEVSNFMYAPSEEYGEKEYYVQVTAGVNASQKSVNSGIVKVTVTETPETVEKKIDAIGEVTLESKDAIDKALNAYNKLSSTDKQKVENASKLIEAQKKYNELKAQEQAKIDDVISKIDAIGKVTIDSEEAIKAARDAYNALEESQQKRVTNRETLNLAELRYASLLADHNKADEVEGLIDEIEEPVTTKSEEAIKAAREAYNALTDAQRQLVENLDKLTSAENALAKLKAPKTGDNSRIAMWFTLLVISIVTLISAAVASKKRKYNK